MNDNKLITAYRTLVSSGVTLGNPVSCSQHHCFLIVIKMEQWNVSLVVSMNINEMAMKQECGFLK